MPLPKVATRTDEERARYNEKMKRYYAAHPEQRRKAIDRIKAKYHGDPEYRERVIERARAAAERRRQAASATVSDISGNEAI